MKLDNNKCEHGCNSIGLYLFKGDWYPCPIHGIKKDIILKSGRLPDGTNLYDVLRIPYEYQGTWVENEDELFRHEGLVHCTPESITSLKSIMHTIYNMVAVDKKVYPVSLYLYGSMIDLKPWMYAIQRIGMENGLSVLPATTVNELAGIIALQEYPTMPIKDEYDISVISKYNRVAAIGADWYLQTELSYVDYLRASLCFIIDNAASSPTNIKILAGFMEERARRGLPTYIISSVFLGDVREPLNSRGVDRYVLSKATPYQLIGKRFAGEVARSGGYTNAPIKDIEGVTGKSVQGRSAAYFLDE